MLRKTIEKEVYLRGIGVFSGNILDVILSPSICGKGIKIIRSDLKENNVIIISKNANFDEKKMSTTVSNGFCSVSLIEHLFSCLWNFGISDIDIYVNGDELPMFDGSAKFWLNAINFAGIHEFDEEITCKYLDKEYVVEYDDKFIIAKPCDNLKITYTMDFNESILGKSQYCFDSTKNSFNKDIALARTFCTINQVEEHKKIKKHFTNNEIIIFDNDKFSVSNNSLRYPSEPIRHKILDIIGDLMSSGEVICCEIVANKSGHMMNRELINKILDK